jgi:hypothetical protein
LSEEGEEGELSSKINPNAARRLGVRRFDASEYLRDEFDVAAYLKAAAAEGDAAYSPPRSATLHVRAVSQRLPVSETELRTRAFGDLESYSISPLSSSISIGRRDWLAASPGRCPASASRNSGVFRSEDSSAAR